MTSNSALENGRQAADLSFIDAERVRRRIAEIDSQGPK